MKLAYVTHYDSRSLRGYNEWSGLGFYIAQSLKSQSLSLDYIGPLEDKLLCRLIQKYKRHYYGIFNQRYLKNPAPYFLKDYAKQIANKLLKTHVDIVFSASANPISYLDCKQPIVFWADASFAGLLNSYPEYSNLCQESIRDWHRVEQLAHQKCNLAIYSSDWAAQAAIEHYNVDPEKVHVVPFGANIESNKTTEEIKDLIESRPSNQCKLLFLGVDWFRKGGDIALKVADGLNKLGLRTELTVVGCQPIVNGSLPSFVRPLGFISKATPEGKEKINRLIAESHFLILPSIAECYGVVFCEANSLGLPCISKRVGGIPTIIKNDLNGRLFDQDCDPIEYSQYIYNLFMNYSQYKDLALSAFHEYDSRLNWNVAGQTVKELLTTLL
jgi:glycosyltransferase involved in cell wall biosynthesis